MRQIIVPIDFSLPSAAAVRFAAYLSRVTQLHVHVVYTFNPMVVSNRRDTPEEQREEKELLMVELDHFVAKHVPPASDIPPIQKTVAEGMTAMVVKKLSQSEDTALVVMGGRETDIEGNDDFFGMIAHTLAREGGCPMLFIPEAYGDRVLHDTVTLFHQLSRSLTYPSRQSDKISS